MKKEIENKFIELQGALAQFFLTLETYISVEEQKKENGEEYDEMAVKNSVSIKMHAGHTMGELVEAKSGLFEELSIPDKLCKAQYESEMDSALDLYVKSHTFSDILNDE